MPLPPAVNFHVNRACNAKCRFCFAVFSEVPGALSRDEALRLIGRLPAAGVEKLNFAGGEPTLWPHLVPALREAKRLGLVTSIVTNGFRLGRSLDQAADCVDWVGFSADSWSEETERALGRGDGAHVARCLALAERCRALGVKVKLNTVLTALNVDEDLSPLVRAMRPERWKVFQVLPVDGQNDGRVEPLLIDASALERFRRRHAHLAAEGFAPVIEDNMDMRGSYAMLDPLGRFFSNASGRHRYSGSALELGVEAAFGQVAFFEARFEGRGGRYAWSSSPRNPDESGTRGRKEGNRNPARAHGDEPLQNGAPMSYEDLLQHRDQSGLLLSPHAWRRMSARGISPEAVHAALAYGRVVQQEGAEVYFIGRKELRRWRGKANLKPHVGLHVVVGRDGVVVTVYRNRRLQARAGRRR